MIRPLLIWVLSALPALALDLSLPSAARQTVERVTSFDLYQAPIGVFADGAVPVERVEGDVHRSAWRIASAGLTPLQVIAPLRAQLEAAQFDIVLDCAAQTCGGFDFRFATETLPGPHMSLDIRNYHFVTGLRRAEGQVDEAITLLASVSGDAAYVQIIQAGTVTPENVIAAFVERDENTAQDDPASMEARLVRDGRVVLDDLTFDIGTPELGEDTFASLLWLSSFLQGRPGLRLALVGHTDTSGGLEANIALSRDRARSVQRRLIEKYGVDETRLEAEGMGYLSPITSNATEEGREQNRRVEVILLGDF
jgi:OOP family OmpA-OmpF porin